jgi:hypothetical protein
MSRKKAKKAVKKIVSSEVWWVPSTFDDNLFMEPSQKGSFFWPLLRFDFREHCPSGSENEFANIDFFSGAAPEVRKEVIPDATVEPPIATNDTVVPQTTHLQDEASPEFTRDLDLIVPKGDEPIQDVSLLETHEDLAKGQDPSPSVDAFNKSFGTLHRGELLSVGCEVDTNKGGEPRVLTLWKSSARVDETGERGSEQSLHSLGEVGRDSRKEPRSSLKKTSASLGKSFSSLGKKVTIQYLSKQGSSLFVNPSDSKLYNFLLMTLIMKLFRVEGPSSFVPSVQTCEVPRRLCS